MHQFINYLAKTWRRFLRRFGRAGDRASHLFLLLLAAVMIAACSSTAINHSEILDSELSPTDCHMVQHEMGETCVPNDPKRIITIPFIFLGNALALDVKPIGSTLPFRETTELTAPYLSTETYLGNRTEGISNLGATHTPSIEKILRLEPDLILAWDLPNIRQIYSRLAQIAPTVVVPYQFSNYRMHANFIAEILAKQEAAQQTKEHYHQRIKALKTALKDQCQNKEISVMGAFDTNNMYAYNQESFPGSILEDLELNRPAAQEVITSDGVIRNISEEELHLIDGDILFFLVFDKESTASFKALQESPLWQTLRAVQEGQVYLVDGDAWIGANLLAADVVIDDLYKYLVNAPSSDT